MRKNLLMIVCAILLLTISSCSSNDNIVDTTTGNQVSNPISVVKIENGAIVNVTTRATDSEMGKSALCFDSEKTFNEFKNKLASMSDNDKQALIAKYHVTNIHDVAMAADEELEEIGNSALSESDFRAKYAKYVSKYEGILVRNSIDTLDLTLYAPDDENVETFIANEDGFYVIGDRVKKADVKFDLSDIVKRESLNSVKQVSRASDNSERLNSLDFRPFSNKIIHFEAYVREQRVWVKMNAKKHMWYGWKNDPARQYFFDSYLGYNFQYLEQGQYGQEIVTGRLPRYIFNKNVKNGFNIILGKITDSNILNGEFHIWCDYTAEHDENGNIKTTKTKDGYVMPVCTEEKAHILKIRLRIQN